MAQATIEASTEDTHVVQSKTRIPELDGLTRRGDSSCDYLSLHRWRFHPPLGFVVDHLITILESRLERCRPLLCVIGFSDWRDSS